MFKHWGKGIAFVGLLVAFLVTALVSSDGIAQAAGPAAHVHLFLTRSARLGLSPTQVLKGPLLYHNGPIVQKSNTYAIFWEPSGHTTAQGYKDLITRYFNDIGGTPFYNTLTQYYQTSPTKFIQNKSTFKGSYVDTTTYPHTGSGIDPLTDADIQAAVVRALGANGWPTGLNNYYFVFTAPNIESCIDASDCTPGTSNPVYCAYHGNFKHAGKDVIYSNMPYGGSYGTDCSGFALSPNANLDADIEISTLSHEHIEGVADPKVSTGPYAWYDAHGYEMADKCGYVYGTIAGDGSNVSLHGHPYIIQLEWSNAAKNHKGGCVKKYSNP